VLLILLLFLILSVVHHSLHSFPTRRSSDLYDPDRRCRTRRAVARGAGDGTGFRRRAGEFSRRAVGRSGADGTRVRLRGAGWTRRLACRLDSCAGLRCCEHAGGRPAGAPGRGRTGWKRLSIVHPACSTCPHPSSHRLRSAVHIGWGSTRGPAEPPRRPEKGPGVRVARSSGASPATTAAAGRG